MTLAEPFAAQRGKSCRYCLYCSRFRDELGDSVMAITFAAPYAARKFLDALLEDDGYVWEDECTIRSESGIVVTTRWWPGRLRECVEHEYTLAEMAWQLQNPQLQWAREFRYGREQRTTEIVERRAREPRTPSAPRADVPAGYIHVSTIAEQLGVEARVARAALRASMQKPAHGWSFSPDELDGVREIIRKRL